MATSGTSTFNRTRDQICSAAGRKILAGRAGETMGARMLGDFAEALNVMVKHWQGAGLHVWTVAEATLFLQAAQSQYVLGSSGDHATESHVETALAVAAVSGASSLTVSSGDDLATGQYIGIELDDGSMFWTTISGSPSTSVTLASPLTGAAASGNLVVAYTTKIVRPLRVVDARRYRFADTNEVSISMVARLDYQSLPRKAQPGTPLQAFYDPRGGATSTGLIKVWPVPSNVNEAIKFTWWRPIQDFSAAGDNPDLPQEWMQTLIFNLAVVMAPEFSVPSDIMGGPTGLVAMAASYLDQIAGWDREAESTVFGIDMTEAW